MMADLEKVIKAIEVCYTLGHNCTECPLFSEDDCNDKLMKDVLSLLKAQEPDERKYEYHTDHTDCPWYISGEESKCPVTCSQYRDGWNDAMNYIFRNGDGYRPYDRIRKGR
jgi:hypothetical protein